MIKNTTIRAPLIGMSSLLIALLLIGFGAPATRTLADTGSNWSAQYWNNTSFSGTPAITRTDATINFNWGNGSPDASLTAGSFSAQWTLVSNFAPGLYTFRAVARGGVRAYVDSTILIDQYVAVTGATTYTSQANLAAGYHRLTVSYYAEGTPSSMVFDWTPPAGTSATSVPVVVAGATATPTGTIIAPIGTGPPIGRIVYDVVNVRADPSITHAPLRQVYNGQVFPIVGETADFQWCLVTLDDGSQGWIYRFAMFISGNTLQIPAATGPTLPPPPLVNVQATLKFTTYLHDRPSAYSGKKTGTIPKGLLVQIQALSTNHAWALVSGGGYSGWVFFPYLIFDSDNINLLNEVPVHN